MEKNKLKDERSGCEVSPAAFAEKFAECGNAYEAAVFAGIPRHRAAAEYIKMLFRKGMYEKVQSKKARLPRCAAAQGLRRLAFGRINDAVKIAFSEELEPGLTECADLYNVSEIKRVKGGGIEIKFFDRQKALEKLLEIEQAEEDSKNSQNILGMIYGRDDGNEPE